MSRLPLCYSRAVIYFRTGRARPIWPAVLAAFALILTVGPVRADAGDTLNFVVGGLVRDDDNLYRLPSHIDPQLVLGKPTRSDRLHLDYFGIQLDKSYSQQRFKFDATASSYRYRTFSQLNFDAVDYSALWNWHITQRLKGNLSADRKQTQTNFADIRNLTGTSTVTTENRRFDADWWLHGSWHLTAGVGEYSWRNSQIIRAQDSLRQRSADIGVRYVAESGSWLALSTRQARGTYDERTLDAPSLLDTGYVQDEVQLKMSWLLSGKSTIDGRITHLKRKHEHFTARDFGGTAGRLDYTLAPTGKVQVKVSAIRDIASFQETTNSYYVNNGFAFAPVWQIGDKTALRLNLEAGQRDYLGGAVVPPPTARRDKTRSLQLSFDWTPVRAVLLSASLQHDQRSSSDINFEYKANSASITGQFAF